MSNIAERDIGKHIQAFASHIYYIYPDRMTEEDSRRWGNMTLIGIGEVTSESDNPMIFDAKIITTDGYGNTNESLVDVHGVNFKKGDKLIFFSIYDEVTKKYSHFAKHLK